MIRRTRWLAVAAIPTLLLIGLTRLTPPVSLLRLDAAPLEPTLITLGYWLAVAGCVWLLGTQILYTLAIVTNAPRLAAVLAPVTLPLIRRVATGATGITLTLSALTTPVLADQTPAPPAVIATLDVADQLVPAASHDATPTPQLTPIDVADLKGSYSAPLTWHVRAGDHLWSIAEAHLSIVLDRQPSLDEHDRYWRLVVEQARSQIRSGDPDLIYPGEDILLPPTMDANIAP